MGSVVVVTDKRPGPSGAAATASLSIDRAGARGPGERSTPALTGESAPAKKKAKKKAWRPGKGYNTQRMYHKKRPTKKKAESPAAHAPLAGHEGLENVDQDDEDDGIGDEEESNPLLLLLQSASREDA